MLLTVDKINNVYGDFKIIGRCICTHKLQSHAKTASGCRDLLKLPQGGGGGVQIKRGLQFDD